MNNNQVNNIAGHLTAANLFGYQPQQQLPEPVTKIKIGHTQDELKAVYPAIMGQAFSITMDNARLFIADYNFRTQAENELIERHNAAVQIYKENNQLAEYEKQILKNFKKRFSALTSRQYNFEVDNAGETFGRFIEKKRIQTIKYATELMFQNFLHLYNSQLQERNDQYKRLKVREACPLPELDTNSFHITQLKRNGVHSLDVCAKTVRNHRLRLQEAGIFLGNTFCGHKKGVKVAVNPQILAVLDLHTEKISVPENQSFIPEMQKELPNNNEPTRAFIDNYKKREFASHNSVDKVSAVPTAFGGENGSTRTPQSNANPVEPATPTEQTGGAAAKKNAEMLHSEALRGLMLHPQQLANELAAGKYDNYIPIDVRILYREAMGGYLTRAEFRELVIQDFFKNSAKLYRGATVYAGSWKKAINYWMQSKFINWQGYHFQKHIVIDYVTELRWRLEHARKFFIKTGIPALYPSNYFDLTRTQSREIGFEFTAKAWKRQLAYNAKLPQEQKKLVKKQKQRHEVINYAKKQDIAINRFLKNKYSLNQLLDYFRNNLPPAYLEALPGTLNRMMQPKN